jgi:hypothetical protein
MSGGTIMAIALASISYFIYLDISVTPQMVVLFVIIFNAFFGYSWGTNSINSANIRSHSMVVSTGNNAFEYPCKRCESVHRNKLGVQLACRRTHSDFARHHQMALISHACVLLCSQCRGGIFHLSRDQRRRIGRHGISFTYPVTNRTNSSTTLQWFLHHQIPKPDPS